MSADIESLAVFERDHYDEYEYYNMREYSCGAGGKGRTKKEIELNGNKHVPAGHERKIEEKLHNSEANNDLLDRLGLALVFPHSVIKTHVLRKQVQLGLL